MALLMCGQSAPTTQKNLWRPLRAGHYYGASKAGWRIMRILIAEDDSILADALIRSLRQSAYAVDHVKNGVEADTALSMQTFDLLILDLGLPRMSGLEVLRRLRARNSNLPVLILTAADSVDDRVKGLDLGADDYMAKPFALNELEARVRALTRRGAGGGPTVVRHGSLSFDQVGRIAYINDQVIELSARELGLLEVLLQRIGRLVSKEQLVDHLCEWGEEVSNNAIEVYVHRLRKKIEPSGVRILTVRGLGYCLEKAAQTAAGASTPSSAAASGAATGAASAAPTPAPSPSSLPATPEPAAPSSPASAAMPASHHFK
jgi:two-component system OmpR family response regulator